MPTVTIGLPFYNQEAYLQKAIRSIMAQTFIDWELVLLDDGSTDNSQQIARQWLSDPRIRLIADGHHQGLATRLNQLANLANGYYLARMDADDLMTPDRLQRQIAFLETHPEMDLAASFAYVINANGTLLGYRGTTQLPTSILQAMNGFPLIHPTVLGKTEWFRQQPYDPQWQRIEDFALWLSVFEKARIYVLPLPLLYYRDHTSFAKYRLAMKEYRHLLMAHPYSVPWQFRQKRYLISHGKTLIVGLAHLLGCQDWLRQQTCTKLSVLNNSPVIVQLFTVASSLLFLKGQPEFWRKHGFSVQVICGPGPELDAFEEAENVLCSSAIPFVRPVRLYHDLLCLIKTYRVLRRISPAVVHVNTPKAAFIGMVAAWLAQSPVRIYEIHGLPFETRRGLKRMVLRNLERLICRLATGIIAISPSLKQLAVSETLAPAANIIVPGAGSCNGVDALHTFHRALLDPIRLEKLAATLPVSQEVVGYIGRLNRDKGLYELSRIWQQIKANSPTATLLLVGEIDGHSNEETQAIEELRNDSRVRMIGHNTDVAYYLALMKVLLLPSHREGFGNVLIEAAAMEVPVVASRVTGVVDAVVDGQTGFLCNLGAIDQFADKTLYYLNNPSVAQQHGQRARQRVLQHFQPETIWQAKLAFYQQQLQQHSRS